MKKTKSKTLCFFFRLTKKMLLFLGSIFFIMLILALTPAPFYMHRALGTDPNFTKNDDFIPEYLVMLGGGGMPSEDNLMRLYYIGQFADFYQIPILIIHPADSLCQVKMTDFLISNNISKENISFLIEGANTRSQVLACKKNYPEMLDAKLLIITSPEHITRSIKCFNKTGFSQLRGQAAFDATVDFNLSLKNLKLDGNKFFPEVESKKIRYTFWNYFKLEITCFREYAALGYYKIKGWI